MFLKKSVMAILVTISIISYMSLYVEGIIIGEIDFYTVKDSTLTSDFQLGDTLILRGQSSANLIRDVEVIMYYPAGSGVPELNLGRRTFTFNAGVETEIVRQQILSNGPTGTYTLRIITYLHGDSTPLDQNDLAFNVSGIPWELVLAIAIVLAAIVIAFLMIRRRRRVEEVGRRPIRAEGTIEITQPGTVQITAPEGTITLLATLQMGSQRIPISSLPQPFGREDFVSFATDTLLNAISRRARPQFTLSYDYARRTFVIEDSTSQNGTLLNGVEIKGKGPQPVKDGDTISPANGAIQLTFACRQE